MVAGGCFHGRVGSSQIRPPQVCCRPAGRGILCDACCVCCPHFSHGSSFAAPGSYPQPCALPPRDLQRCILGELSPTPRLCACQPPHASCVYLRRPGYLHERKAAVGSMGLTRMCTDAAWRECAQHQTALCDSLGLASFPALVLGSVSGAYWRACQLACLGLLACWLRRARDSLALCAHALLMRCCYALVLMLA